jgi:hypothetical protein
MSLSKGADLILAERERQISEEGYNKTHDSFHNYEEFIWAAISYSINSFNDDESKKLGEQWWPWSEESYKPKDVLQNLKRAGALIAAAIDRYEEGT